MYRQLANYYDEIYHFKDYQKEAEKIETLINQYKKSPGNNLLDVACGTGNHIAYFKQHYSVEGLDFSSEMLPRRHDQLQTQESVRHHYLPVQRHWTCQDKGSDEKSGPQHG